MVNMSEDLEGLMWAIHCIWISVCMLYGIVAGGGMLFDLLKGMVSLPEGKKTNTTCYQYEMLN
jgi:hypothetical protein